MHLDTKSFLLLASPFIAASGIWFFSGSIVNNLDLIFELPQQQKDSTLQEQKDMYQFLSTNKDEYSSLLKKIKQRQENRFWISERLYRPFTPISQTVTNPVSPLLLLPPPLLPFSDGNISTPEMVLSVQMVLPEQSIAIINNHIMRLGQSINGVKLLQIKDNSVFIQTNKGSQWVKLFH
jgi:hypothetical protein